MEGLVKFFKAESGWGVIVSPAVPGDVWVHFSHIEADGWSGFEAGDIVDFEAEQVEQTPFHWRATRARFLRPGPAPALRRIGGRVVIADPGIPDTPLTPRSRGFQESASDER